jgi:hypothetical protein
LASRVAVAARNLTPKVAPLATTESVQVVVSHVETVAGVPVKWGSTSSMKSAATILVPYENVNVTSVAVPTACWLNVAACVNAAIVTASERDIATADTVGALNATVYVEESDAAAAEAIVKSCNSISHGVWAARVAVLILKQTAKSEFPAVPVVDVVHNSTSAEPQPVVLATARVPLLKVGSAIVNSPPTATSASNVNAKKAFLPVVVAIVDSNVSESS